MRSFALYAGLMLLALPTIAYASSPSITESTSGHNTPPALSTMHMTFDDEFNANQLDHTKWVTHYNYLGQINGEQQVYVPDAIVPDATDGVLRLRADKRAFNGYPYTSGIITTFDHFSQTYGYFEAKIRQPETRGFWPGFWLFAQQRIPSMNWGDEIDIAENHTAMPNQTGHNWHFHSFTMNGGSYTTHKFAVGADYHIYGVEWRKGIVIYYVDGAEVYRITGSTVSSQPMFILLNLAVSSFGGRQPDNTTVWPSSMDIDYVRAYQFNNAPAEPNIPIKVGPLVLSSYNVKPGDVVKVEADLDVGNADLTGPVTMGLGFSDFNGGQIQYTSSDGAKKWVGWSGGVYMGPNISGNYTGTLKANQRAVYTSQFTVPADLPTGVYNICYRPSLKGNYFGGTTIAARFYVNNPQSTGGKTQLLPLASLPAPLATGDAPVQSNAIQSRSSNVHMSLGTTTISPSTASVGKTVTVTGTVHALDNIPAGYVALVVRDNTDNAHAKRYLNTLVRTPSMQAGQTKSFSASFAIPSTMAPGSYNISSYVGGNMAGNTNGLIDDQKLALKIQ